MSGQHLPEGWATARLADVAEVRLGRQRSPKNATGDRMRPYLRAANVKWSGLDLTDVKEMAFSEQESATYELRPGDILLGEASGSPSEVGKPGQYRGEIEGCCFQNTLLRIRLADGLLPDFFEHYFRQQALGGKFAAGSRGVGIYHLGAKALSDWHVPVPPGAEQARVVTAIDEALAKLAAGEAGVIAARRLLDRMQDALLASSLQGWPQRGSQVHRPSVETDSQLPRVPPHWTWAALGDIAQVVGGVTKDSKKQDHPDLVEVPYLRVANVQRGFLNLSSVATIRVDAGKARRLELRSGDVLFNEGGDRDKLGRGWVWRGEIPRCIHQNHVFRARLDNRMAPEFVSWWGNTFGRRWFEQHGKQSTNLASINLSTLKSFPVPMPPRAEQDAIVRDVEQQLSFIASCERSVESALLRITALRRSVLQAAFEGRLVPQDPADEPAERLLARVRLEHPGAAPSPTRRAGNKR